MILFQNQQIIKLKVTDKINGNFSDTESKLFTIYATYKKGKVTVTTLT